jgi:hypothetical protein
MKLKLYLDTSVVGGYFDEEFEAETKLFFDFNSVNLRMGYPIIEIRSPKEFIFYEDSN